MLIQVTPEKLGVTARDGIRSQLLDETMLHYLESCAAINWNSDIVWQARPIHIHTATPSTAVSPTSHKEEEWMNVDHLAPQLEEGYRNGPKQTAFSSGYNTFQVNYENNHLINGHTGGTFELRRLAFAPLMPLKVSVEIH